MTAKASRRKMGIWFLTSLAPTCFSEFATASSNELAPSETAQTVWAAQGRATAPVAYEMKFFPKAARPTSGGKPRTQVLQDGEWIRIKVGDQEGYVFNKLLLPYPPIRAGEDTEHYLARIFELTPKPAVNHGGAIDTEYVSHGPRKIHLVRHESSEAAASGGEVFIPDMSFDEAFVFVNAILPPTPDARRGLRVSEGSIVRISISSSWRRTLNPGKGRGALFLAGRG